MEAAMFLPLNVMMTSLDCRGCVAVCACSLLLGGTRTPVNVLYNHLYGRLYFVSTTGLRRKPLLFNYKSNLRRASSPVARSVTRHIGGLGESRRDTRSSGWKRLGRR